MPTSYTSLSFLAASYNPSLYGTWPSSLSVGVYTGTQYGVSGYGGVTGTGPSNVPTNGAGCSFGTSLGLSAPMYTILQAAAAALDPSGTLLPSWRTLWQPCPPYKNNVLQNSSSVMYGRSWAGVVCQDSSACNPTTMVGGVSQLWLNWLGLNGSVPAVLGQMSTLSFVDVSRNVLAGTLPPELGNISHLQLSVVDNNITGTVPSSYSSLSWLAAAYNPFLYGAWPSSVPVAGLTLAGNGSGSYSTTSPGGVGVTGSSTVVPTTGAGCGFGTSLGLDAPLYTILQSVAAALDPSGALLPSWRTGWQPCPPYSVTVAQGAGSTMYGKAWAGVTCADGPAGCTPSNIVGGASQVKLNGLGLNGTLPAALLQLRVMTALDLSQNALVSSIPPAWCVTGLASAVPSAMR